MRHPRLLGRAGSWRLLLLVALLAAPSVGCVHEKIGGPASKVFVDGKAVGPACAAFEDEPERQGPPKPSSLVACGEWLRTCGDTDMSLSRKADSDRRRLDLRTEASQRYAAAKERYLQALQLDPNEAGAHLGLGRVAAAEGQFAAAHERFLQALRVQPNNPAIHFDIGMAYARQKNWDSALASLKRAAELDPANANIATNYAWTLARAERFEEAWHVFRPLLGEGKAYYRLALMTHHLGRKDLTRAYLTY